TMMFHAAFKCRRWLCLTYAGNASLAGREGPCCQRAEGRWQEHAAPARNSSAGHQFSLLD
ncbi:MAG: hypothetical protein ACK56I_24115, partial [bacterium]